MSELFPYQPKPDDLFHAVGYTSRDVSDQGLIRLLGLSNRVMMENDKLWQQLGPLVPAMKAGKVKREYVEVLSLDPFMGNQELPYFGSGHQSFMCIEYLSDEAFRLCREYGIQHPPVIEKVKRADIPLGHGITLQTIHFSQL